MKTIIRLFCASVFLATFETHALGLGINPKAWLNWAKPQEDCSQALSQAFANTHDAQRAMRDKLVQWLGEEWLEKQPFGEVLNDYTLGVDSPLLVAAVWGSVSSGKSTFINAFEAKMAQDESINRGRPRSQVSPAPDETKRMLILLGKQMAPYRLLENPSNLPIAANENAAMEISKQIHTNPEYVAAISPDESGETLVLKDVNTRFHDPVPWTSAADSAQPGPPMILETEHLPPHLAVLDVPGGTSDEHGREVAEAALRRSDVVILMLNKDTVGIRSSYEVVRDAYKKSGKKEIIVVYQGSVANTADQIRHNVKVAVDVILDSSGPELPPEVLAIYLMPFEDSVAEQRAHPKFVPVPVSEGRVTPELPDLFNEIARNSYKHKAYAKLEAAKMVEGSVQSLIRERVKAELARQIVRKSLRAMINTSSQNHLENFPYNKYADIIIDGRRRHDKPTLWHKAESFFTILSEGWWRKLFASGPPKPRSGTNGELQDTSLTLERAGRQAQNILTEYASMLRSGVIHLVEDQAKEAKDVFDDAKAYYEEFPEELGKPIGDDAPPGRLSFRLPRLNLLPEPAQEVLAKAGEGVDAKELKELTKVLEDLEVAALSSANQKIMSPRSSWERWKDRFVAYTTPMMGLGTLSGMESSHYHLYIAIPVAIAAWVGPQNLWRLRRNAKNEKRINEDYKYDQNRAIQTYLREKKVSAILDRLTVLDRDDLDAMVTIERALKYIDPSYPVISTILEAQSKELVLVPTDEPSRP